MFSRLDFSQDLTYNKQVHVLRQVAPFRAQPALHFFTVVTLAFVQPFFIDVITLIIKCN